MGDGELITGLPQQFLDEFEAEIRGRVPAEKVKAQLRQEKIGRIMKQVGSTQIDTLGQRIAVIDRRLYFRAMQAFGHHEGWLEDLLKDNKFLCAPGYNPGRKADLRHGITFVGGVPTGQGPKILQ
jgi:hypothetical protein